MYTKPLVIGVRQYQDWSAEEKIENILNGLGQNTGNLIFTQALEHVISGAKWASFRLAHEDYDGHDVIVLAAANWVNSFDDFTWLVERLEKCKLPIVMVGLGAQATLDHEQPVLPDATIRLLKLVSERSASIAARGDFTCEVLSHLGIKNVEATGCPSMLLANPAGLPGHAIIEAKSGPKICLHATRHGYGTPGALDAYIYRQALESDCDILLQSEIPDMLISLGRENEEILVKAERALRISYGSSDASVIDFLRRHGRAFPNFGSWIEYGRSMTLFLGTRIHGTVAALVAGTPALLVVHDSRTLEMAKSMSIPFVMAKDIDTSKRLQPEKLAQSVESRFSDLRKRHMEYRGRFKEFFNRNRLPTSL